MTPPDPTSTDAATLRDVAVAVADAAGALLVDAVAGERTLVDTKSSATDMVTEMDRASERAAAASACTSCAPTTPSSARRAATAPGTTGVTWVVDPLDGTTNYLYRYPGWNVSVGAEIDGVPVAGAVVVPATGDRFAAAVGHGATRNGAPIRLGEPAPLATSLLGTGFNYDPATRARPGPGRWWPSSTGSATSGVAAPPPPTCARWPAAGSTPSTRSGLAPWDRSAGTVIAREAGARVEVLADTPLADDCTVAAHPERFDELVACSPRPAARLTPFAKFRLLVTPLVTRNEIFGSGWGMPAPSGLHEARWSDMATRILTVEDDERIRTAVKLALEDEGWTVAEADTGEDGPRAVPARAGRRRAHRHHAARASTASRCAAPSDASPTSPS